jgi:hypothetical protein
MTEIVIKLLQDKANQQAERESLSLEVGKMTGTIDSASVMLQRMENKLKVAVNELASADREISSSVDVFNELLLGLNSGAADKTTVESILDESGAVKTTASHRISVSVQTGDDEDSLASTSTTDYRNSTLPNSELLETNNKRSLSEKRFLSNVAKRERKAAYQRLQYSVQSTKQYCQIMRSENAQLKSSKAELLEKLQEAMELLEEERNAHRRDMAELKSTSEEQLAVQQEELCETTDQEIQAVESSRAELKDNFEDAVFCLESLTEYTHELQQRFSDVLQQKQLLASFCFGYERARENVSDLAASCVVAASETAQDNQQDQRPSFSSAATATTTAKRGLEFNPLLASVIARNNNPDAVYVPHGVNNNQNNNPTLSFLRNGLGANLQLRRWRVGVAQRGFDGRGRGPCYYLPTLRIVGLFVTTALRFKRLGELKRDKDRLRQRGTALTGRSSSNLRLIFKQAGKLTPTTFEQSLT